MEWKYDDGGRAEAGFKGKGSVRDCVTRAIAIIGEDDYRTVYDELDERQKEYIATSRSARAKKLRASGKRKTPRNAVLHPVWKQYLVDHGWRKETLVEFGSSDRVHLDAAEAPSGTYIAQTRKHLVAVVDGVAHDAWNSVGEGNRMIYTVWHPPTAGN